LSLALHARLGDRAALQAPALLLDLIAAGYCLFHFSEIPTALREDGVLATVAAELERDAEGQAAAAAMHHTRAARTGAQRDAAVRP
jgi:hypothetical protein